MSDMPNENELREEVDAFFRKNFPKVRMHGGKYGINRVDPDEGLVQLRLGGTCSGCGLSPMTINAIQQRLTQQVDGIDTVEVNILSEGGTSSRNGVNDSPDAPF